MLLIPVHIAESAIHGFGVFASKPIEKGTLIWRFTPGFDLDIDPRVLEEQSPDFREVLLHYGYIDPRLNRFILCCDDARFINHSDVPNVISNYEMDRYGIDFAVRDIDQGEEITVDYEVLQGYRPE